MARHVFDGQLARPEGRSNRCTRGAGSSRSLFSGPVPGGRQISEWHSPALFYPFLYLLSRLYVTGSSQQTQLGGAGNSLGAPMNPQFTIDFPIMTFNGIQSKEELLAYLTI